MRVLGLWVACFFWGISFIASKAALESAPPLTVVALRLLIAAACFLVWFAVKGWPKVASWRAVFVLSLLGTSLHYGAQTAGLQYTTASNASLYAATCPVFIALTALFFLSERLSGRKALGILLALAGVLAAMGPRTLLSIEFGGHLWGDFLVLVSICLWALFTVYSKKLYAGSGAMELLGLATIAGAATMLPIGAAELWWRGATLAAITLKSWLAIGFLGLTCSFFAALLYFLALERMESQKVGVYLYTIPPMTYAAAWALLGERVGWNLAVGSVLVLAGVNLTERG
ncbi:MAG: DMT family transporter [Elusimicrobia bacterium]|nr:DMT family transporter [Elusimicrobiota bacterium]